MLPCYHYTVATHRSNQSGVRIHVDVHTICTHSVRLWVEGVAHASVFIIRSIIDLATLERSKKYPDNGGKSECD